MNNKNRKQVPLGQDQELQIFQWAQYLHKPSKNIKPIKQKRKTSKKQQTTVQATKYDFLYQHTEYKIIRLIIITLILILVLKFTIFIIIGVYESQVRKQISIDKGKQIRSYYTRQSRKSYRDSRHKGSMEIDLLKQNRQFNGFYQDIRSDNNNERINQLNLKLDQNGFPEKIAQQQQQNTQLKVHSFTVDQLIQHTDIQNFQPKGGIKKDQFIKSIERLILPNSLTYTNHAKQSENVNELNKQSDKITQLNKSIQRSKITSHNIQHKNNVNQLLNEQRQEMKQKYKIHQNNYDNELEFCIVLTGKSLITTNSKQINPYIDFINLKRTLKSILMQQYQRYHIVYSADLKEGIKVKDQNNLNIGQKNIKKIIDKQQFINQFIQQQKFPSQMLLVINSTKTKTQMIYHSILKQCKPKQIILLIDQGDSLIGTQVFSTINSQYKSQNKPSIIYTQHIITDINGQVTMGSSNEYQNQIIQQHKFRQLRKLFVLNLVTFYADLFFRINVNDLKFNHLKGHIDNNQNNPMHNQHNQFYQHLTYESIVFPILQMATPKIQYLQQIMYEIFDNRSPYQKTKQLQIKRKQFQQFYYKDTYKQLENHFLSEEQYKKVIQFYKNNQSFNNVIKNNDKTSDKDQLISVYNKKNIKLNQKEKQFNEENNQENSINLINDQVLNQNNTLSVSQKLNGKQNHKQSQIITAQNSIQIFNRSLQQMISWGKRHFHFEQTKNITLEQFMFSIERLWLNNPTLNKNMNKFRNSLLDDQIQKQQTIPLNQNSIKQKQNNQQEAKSIELTTNNEQQKQQITNKPDNQQFQQYLSTRQKQYFNKKYNLTNFISTSNHQLTFCIVVPSYNNFKTKLYLRNLNSIFMQQYTNYHVVYIDDNSPDSTGQYVKQYINQNNISSQKINLIINKQNQGAMSNIYHAIKNYCHNGEIVIMIDGDDSLVGRQVFNLINLVFQKDKIALLYSQHIQITDNYKAQVGICRPYQRQFFQQNTFRAAQDARSSHLKAFYVDLFNKIDISSLTYDGVNFFKATSDTAIMKPMLQMANPKIKYLNQILYEYRYDTGINGNFVHKKQQKYVKRLITTGKKYEPIKDFYFIKQN